MESPSYQPNELALTRAEYDLMVAAVRAQAAAAIPADMVAAVISKGDARLTDIAPARGWHFPRDASGEYLGYYPASGQDATSHLRNLYEAGARYLVIPRTAAWWLGHYEELRIYLEQSATAVAEDHACTIYALGAPADPPAPADRRDHQDGAAIRDLVNRLLPPSASVILLSEEMELLTVDFGTRPVRVMGCTDLTEIMAADTPSRSEIGFLVAPPDLPAHFGHCGRLVTRQRHLCTIYELGGS